MGEVSLSAVALAILLFGSAILISVQRPVCCGGKNSNFRVDTVNNEGFGFAENWLI